MLVSKLAFSSEIWYNVKDNQLRKLEQIDEMLFWQIFMLPSTAPRVGMLSECGRISIRHLVKKPKVFKVVQQVSYVRGICIKTSEKKNVFNNCQIKQEYGYFGTFWTFSCY